MSLLFLGDSITEWWDPQIYKNEFLKYNPINLGIKGHCTDHLINLVQNTFISQYNPTVFCILIGTNNSDKGDTTAKVFNDIEMILTIILDDVPNCNILLLGLLPRGQTVSCRQRVFNESINKLLNNVDLDPRIHYIDVGHIFLDTNGVILQRYMWDFLHLTSEGYQRLADAIREPLASLFSSAFRLP